MKKCLVVGSSIEKTFPLKKILSGVFLETHKIYVYFVCYSPKHTVCVLEVMQVYKSVKYHTSLKHFQSVYFLD